MAVSGGSGSSDYIKSLQRFCSQRSKEGESPTVDELIKRIDRGVKLQAFSQTTANELKAQLKDLKGRQIDTLNPIEKQRISDIFSKALHDQGYGSEETSAASESPTPETSARASQRGTTEVGAQLQAQALKVAKHIDMSLGQGVITSMSGETMQMVKAGHSLYQTSYLPDASLGAVPIATFRDPDTDFFLTALPGKDPVPKIFFVDHVKTQRQSRSDIRIGASAAIQVDSREKALQLIDAAAALAKEVCPEDEKRAVEAKNALLIFCSQHRSNFFVMPLIVALGGGIIPLEDFSQVEYAFRTDECSMQPVYNEKAAKKGVSKVVPDAFKITVHAVIDVKMREPTELSLEDRAENTPVLTVVLTGEARCRFNEQEQTFQVDPGMMNCILQVRS